MVSLKKCGECKKLKETSEFSKNKKSKDGLQRMCRSCCKKYRLNNLAREKERQKIYYEENKESILDRQKKFKEENYEHYMKISRGANKKYYQDNKEKQSIKNKIWRENNKDRVSSRKRKYYRENPNIYNKRRAMKLNVSEVYTKEDKEYTESIFNRRCFNCGETSNICIDHHMPLSKGHALTRKNAVLLCKSCNSKKGNKNPEDFYSKEKLTELHLLLGRNN